jgi:hypothetical protein
LGVAPPKRSRVPDHPTEPAAVDRRRQIVDENRSGARR